MVCVLVEAVFLQGTLEVYGADLERMNLRYPSGWLYYISDMMINMLR